MDITFHRLRYVHISLLATLLLGGCAGLMQSSKPPGSIPAVAPRMQQFVDKGEISGVVTLIAARDRIIHINAVGKSDLASGRAMKTDDIFWIASMTKPLTAVCMGILKDEGKLKFDDPLSTYLPEFANQTLASGAKPSRPITIRDVLTHTSGLGELTRREEHWSLAEMSQALAKTPLRFEPGSRWAYSTAGMDVMGRVVEVVSGTRFDDFMQTRIFDPLGMKDTRFKIAPVDLPRWGKPYQWNSRTGKLDDTTISYLYGTEVTDPLRAPSGGAGLFSTAEDMCKFYQMMLNNGSFHGRRILKPETVAEMTRKQTGNLTARPGMPWGLGFCVVEDPSAMEGNKPLSPNSFGHGGAYSTQSWADPTKNLIWIVMFNRNGKGNPDNSDVRIAFEAAAVPALGK